MALFGMVFALGAGQAAAQATLTNGTLEIEADDPVEGGATTVTVTLSAEVPANSATATPVNVEVTGAARTDGDATPAEDGDWTITNPASNTDAATATLEFEFPVNNTNDSVRHTLTNTVMLQTRNHDADAEDEDLMLTASIDTPDGGLSGLTDEVLNLTIDDDETQTYVLALEPATQTPEEGGMVMVQVSAVPPHVQGSKLLTINIDRSAPDYTFMVVADDTTATDAVTGTNQVRIGVDAATPANATTTATITLTTPANDANRVDDTVMMTAYSGQPGAGMLEASLAIVLADLHALPAITATLTDANGMAVTDGMLMEGMTYMLTLSAPAAVSEDITVSVMKASGTADPMDDYSLGQSLIMIPSGQTSSAAVSLEVDLNDDIVRTPVEVDRRIRSKWITRSGRSGSPNPAEADRVRPKWITVVSARR